MLTKETLIRDRLRDRSVSNVLDYAKHVVSSAAITSTKEFASLCPLVIIHPGQAPLQEASINAKAYTDNQAFTVSVLVKITGENELDENYDAAASDLLLAIVEALAGWTPDDWSEPMRYLGRDAPDVTPGYAEFPLQFEILNEFQG